MYPPLRQQLLGLNTLYRERLGVKSKVRSEPGSVNGVTQCGRRSEEGDAVTRGRVPWSPPRLWSWGKHRIKALPWSWYFTKKRVMSFFSTASFLTILRNTAKANILRISSQLHKNLPDQSCSELGHQCHMTPAAALSVSPARTKRVCHHFITRRLMNYIRTAVQSAFQKLFLKTTETVLKISAAPTNLDQPLVPN